LWERGDLILISHLFFFLLQEKKNCTIFVKQRLLNQTISIILVYLSCILTHDNVRAFSLLVSTDTIILYRNPQDWALIWDPFAWCQRIQLPIKQYQLALWFRYRCAHRNGHQFLEPLEWHLGCVTLLFGGSILWYNIFGNITDSFLYPFAFQAKTLNDSTTRPSSGDHECSLKCRLRMSELSTLWCLICWQFARSAPMTRCTATPFTDLISYSQQWSTDY